jgi:hypothetical protein
MALEEREQIRRETLRRAVALVQRYRNQNRQQLGVNDICLEISRLLKTEAATTEPEQ